MEIVYNLNEVEKVAKHILNNVNSKTLLLDGTLGTGKTTLTKAIIKELGSNDDASSPTFSLVNEYKTNDGNTIYHFDLYRVNHIEELYNIGIEDYLYSGHWIIIEWPDIIESLLPEDINRILLESNSNETRTLKLKF